MRLLYIDYDGTELAQGFVRAEWPRQSDLMGGRANAWIRMFLRSASLWNQARPLSAAVRISIEPGRPVTTVHSFVVAKSDEERMRRLLAAFMRTDQLGAGHTEGLASGMAPEGPFIHLDEPRIAMVRESLQAGSGLFIHHNLRLADQLPRLLQTFSDLDMPFAYELQAAPWTPPRERLKEFLYNLSRLNDTPGIPPQLAEDQIALGNRLKRATFHIEECLSSPKPELAGTLADTLVALLAESFYSRFDATPRLAPVGAGAAEAFGHHVHSHLMLGVPDDTVAELTAATTREDVDRCISCLPLGLGFSGTASSGGAEAEPLALSLGPIPSGSGASPNSPPPPPPANPFLFVSYARADLDQVYPLVDQLAKHGASVWIDRRIVGGDDWIAELEAQLMLCSGVVALSAPRSRSPNTAAARSVSPTL
jgi:hypothetical protein